MTSLAPRSASSFAVASPRPDAPPVTIADAPEMSMAATLAVELDRVGQVRSEAGAIRCEHRGVPMRRLLPGPRSVARVTFADRVDAGRRLADALGHHARARRRDPRPAREAASSSPPRWLRRCGARSTSSSSASSAPRSNPSSPWAPSPRAASACSTSSSPARSVPTSGRSPGSRPASGPRSRSGSGATAPATAPLARRLHGDRRRRRHRHRRDGAGRVPVRPSGGAATVVDGGAGGAARRRRRARRTSPTRSSSSTSPSPFGAVGRWYRNFEATTDDEVVALLAASSASLDPRTASRIPPRALLRPRKPASWSAAGASSGTSTLAPNGATPSGRGTGRGWSPARPRAAVPRARGRGRCPAPSPGPDPNRG